MPIDRAAPVTFLRTAFHEDDWVAVFLKSYQSGRVAQRVRPVQQIQSAKFQAWLRAENAAGANVYVSVNTLAPYQRSRRRDSVREIRHVFLDADSAAQEVLDAIETATALPSPSYVMRSSPGRAHLFWRVNRFTSDTVEALERHLARKLGTDPAATACTQVTRLPGFVNHKRATPYLISIEYGDTNRLYQPTDFPKPPPRLDAATLTRGHRCQSERCRSSASVRRRYTARNLRTAWRRPHVPRLLSRHQGLRVGGRRSTRRTARVEQPLRAALVRS